MYRPYIIFRIQIAVLIATGVLGLIFLFFYQPLTRRETEKDLAIEAVGKKLMKLNSSFKGSLGTDLETTSGNRRLAEKSLAAMRNAAQFECARISLAQEWRDQVHQPFSILMYNYKLEQLTNELKLAAQSKNVSLDPTNTAKAYPEYEPVENNQAQYQAQLWAQMFVADQILRVAVENSTKAVKSASLLPILTHPSVDDGHNVLDEFPMHIELAGTAESIFNFMRSLPLRPDELKALGLPVTSEAKPALFLQRFILQRDFSDPNYVSLDAVVSGLVARDLPPN